MLIALLPDGEQNKQNEWFASIVENKSTFKEDAQQWLSKSEELLYNGSLGQYNPAVIAEGEFYFLIAELPSMQ